MANPNLSDAQFQILGPAARYADALTTMTARALPEGHGNYSPPTFAAGSAGRKYTKVVQNGGGIHAFVHNETGEVYKPAGYNRPAKGARYGSVDAALESAGKSPHTAHTGDYLYRNPGSGKVF